MLAIRMQRTGRRGHAQFRLVVQDSRFSPTSGRVVARLGSYNPHTKVAKFDADKVAAYLKNGAQPSERVVKILKQQGVELPGWVAQPIERKRVIRHSDKLRRNRPPAEPEAQTEAPETQVEPQEKAADTPEARPEAPETPAEEAVESPPAEEAAPAEPEVAGTAAEEPAPAPEAEETAASEPAEAPAETASTEPDSQES